MFAPYSSYEYNLDTGTCSDTKECFIGYLKLCHCFEQRSTNTVFTECDHVPLVFLIGNINH